MVKRLDLCQSKWLKEGCSSCQLTPPLLRWDFKALLTEEVLSLSTKTKSKIYKKQEKL